MGCRVLGRLDPRVALVDKREADCLSRDLLDLGSQLCDLGPILFVGGGDMQCQQVTQGIYRHMHLTAPLAFGAIISSTGATFWSRLPCSAIKNGRRGRHVTPLGQPQEAAQVVDG
jgi:hypothetical protein